MAAERERALDQAALPLRERKRLIAQLMRPGPSKSGAGPGLGPRGALPPPRQHARRFAPPRCLPRGRLTF